MKNDDFKILEQIDLPQGMEIDLNEGWRKLISSQFGGNPGRGFSELIQNLLDSYSPDTPWENRRGEIETTRQSISITDYGEGMNLKRLKLLTTLGGTDKKDDPSKIGKFGLGFFANFNPKLGTKTIIVTTKCDSQPVRLVFRVIQPEKRPKISTQVLDEDIPFSTRIEVNFNNERSPGLCMESAALSLQYYPCCISINGKAFSSIWQTAKQSDAYFFSEGHSTGFLKNSSWKRRAVILCKYERIPYSPFYHLVKERLASDMRKALIHQLLPN